MRYKFRALDAASKEWVYGYYVVLDSGYELVDCIWKLGAKLATPIDRSTLGQYTGLTDKNGTEIYEGDIVTSASPELIFQVVYKTSSFCRKWADDVSKKYRYPVEPMAWNTHIICEIIGNIYQNPELVKENEK